MKLCIGGKLINAGDQKKQTIICPANEEKVAEIAWAIKEDALIALNEGQKGFAYWSELSLAECTIWMTK